MGKFRRSFRLAENMQVRVHRTTRLSAAVSDTMELQDTIGDEEAVLVVVDPQELPRTWASVDLLAEQIGEGTYRAVAEDVAPDQSVTMDEDWGVQLKNRLPTCIKPPASSWEKCIWTQSCSRTCTRMALALSEQKTTGCPCRNTYNIG